MGKDPRRQEPAAAKKKNKNVKGRRNTGDSGLPQKKGEKET